MFESPFWLLVLDPFSFFIDFSPLYYRILICVFIIYLLRDPSLEILYGRISLVFDLMPLHHESEAAGNNEVGK